MNKDSIIPEIHRIIDERIENRVVTHVEWVAKAILDSRSDIAGGDAPFYRDCTFKEVARLVKSAIGKYKAEDVTSDQLLFPGFKHLCRAYPFTRDGNVVLVPVSECTEAELMARADELEKQAKGCRAHAREIREFIMARQSGGVAA